MLVESQLLNLLASAVTRLARYSSSLGGTASVPEQHPTADGSLGKDKVRISPAPNTEGKG